MQRAAPNVIILTDNWGLVGRDLVPQRVARVQCVADGSPPVARQTLWQGCRPPRGARALTGEVAGQNRSRERGSGTLKYERLFIDEIDGA